MVKVVITGGAGFVAQHLIRRLNEAASEVVTEISTIDRGEYNPLFIVKSSIPQKNFCFDLNDKTELGRVLEGADVVFHLARKQFDLLLNDSKEEYLRDNYDATKNVVDVMIEKNVKNLIYMSDAYANVPPQDNFGNSEQVHDGVPYWYLMGNYGVSKNKAELYVREVEKQGNLNAVIFKPTVIYGEGTRHIIEALKKVAEENGGYLPQLEGASSGLLQYIYVGHLVMYMEEALRIVITKPKDISGQFFYVMDKTEAAKFTEVFQQFLKPFDIKLQTTSSLLYYKSLWAQIKSLFSPPTSSNLFNINALRLYFTYAVGFSNRKQQLIFKTRPELAQEETFERYSNWLEPYERKPIARRGNMG